MRHPGTVLGAGVLLTLLAGCAGQQAGQQASAGTGPGSSTSSASPASGSAPAGTRVGPAMPGIRLPVGAEPVPGNRVDASSVAPTFPRELWTQGDGSVIGFYGTQGGCQTVGASVDDQTDARVVIRLIEQEPAREQLCTRYGYQPMTVKLEKPLGARTVVLQMSIQRG